MLTFRTAAQCPCCCGSVLLCYAAKWAVRCAVLRCAVSCCGVLCHQVADEVTRGTDGQVDECAGEDGGNSGAAKVLYEQM